MDVAVAAGLLAHQHRASQIRQNGLKVGNDRLHPLRFGFHPQQGLLEIEIERKWSDQIEREIRSVNLRRV